jgi:hypothetical protein
MRVHGRDGTTHVDSVQGPFTPTIYADLASRCQYMRLPGAVANLISHVESMSSQLGQNDEELRFRYCHRPSASLYSARSPSFASHERLSRTVHGRPRRR